MRTAPLIEPRYQLPIFEVTPLIVTASPMQAKLEAGPRPTFDNDSIEFVNQFCYILNKYVHKPQQAEQVGK